MKITKRQLRRIIKEEKRKLLCEQSTRGGFEVFIETIGKDERGEPLLLPADINALAFDLEQELATWAQSIGVKVWVKADYES